MLDFTPPSVAFSIGSINVYYYGLCYALGLVLVYWVIAREARHRGLDVDELANGLIVISIAALAGGRLYHVIDQWALYADDPIRILLPPYTGLGAFGGMITGIAVGLLYVRWRRQPVLAWADAAAPGIFAMQFVARWGNFFNQELYGPPTSLPWGIPIECERRVAEFLCPPLGAFESATTRFHPLFLYESLSGLLGLLALVWIGRRFAARLRRGDLLLLFLVWYSAVRFGLETLRTDRWTIDGIPTAQLVAGALIAASLLLLAWRHRPGAPAEAPLPGTSPAERSSTDEVADRLHPPAGPA